MTKNEFKRAMRDRDCEARYSGREKKWYKAREWYPVKATIHERINRKDK